MNRAERRAMAKAGGRAESLSAAPTVKLVGGPMAGWTVTLDAPCLMNGWGQITTDDPSTGYVLRKHTALWHTDLEPASADEVDAVTRAVLKGMGAKEG